MPVILEKKNWCISTSIPVPLLKKPPAEIPPLKKKVLVLAGPTAVGKSQLALELARLIDGEIVSADSMQVYSGMDIGTAKVSPSLRQKVPHHLIDICSLQESFNVLQFYQAAYRAIQEITSRERVPIVVGGTGFYLHALLYGPPQGPPPSLEERAKLEREVEEKGVLFLYERLFSLDPEYARTISSGDRQKIIRALEIIALSQKKVSDFSLSCKPQEDRCAPERYHFCSWFLYLSKEELYARIEERCDAMLQAGFVDEVKALEKQGLRKNLSAAQAIGYRQCLTYLDSQQTEKDWEAFVLSFKQASRRYAKRQFTWFRKEPFFRWLDIGDISLERLVEVILRDYEYS